MRPSLQYIASFACFGIAVALLSESAVKSQTLYTKCSGNATGCYSDYNCSPSGYQCPTGVANTKKGRTLGHRYCATWTAPSCTVTTVPCFRETHYEDGFCIDACAVLYNYADGCTLTGEG